MTTQLIKSKFQFEAQGASPQCERQTGTCRYASRLCPVTFFSLSSHPKQARPLSSRLTRSGREGSWGGRLEIGVKRKDTDGSSDRFHRSAPPVAVPEKIFGLTPILDFFDRCHSLRSLYPPQAALPSLPPSRFFAYFLAETRK